MANPTRPVLTIPAAKPEVTLEVTSEVTAAAPAAELDAARDETFNAARAARFVTTTGDAPVFNGPTNLGKLNAKTLAEHAAGKEALAQYAPAE
jgi:hypothetical protein